jgi:hypothetical protein
MERLLVREGVNNDHASARWGRVFWITEEVEEEKCAPSAQRFSSTGVLW